MERLTELEAMKLAIEQAKQGLGFVSPNPVVGCVILDSEGKLLSHGYHAKAGQDHAEICALKKVSNEKLLKDAQVYVTLEPCSHFGRTPPCAERLAKLPIREVIYGVKDPNPKVSGRGIQILEAAGKSVRTLPELQREIEELTEVFLFNMRREQSFVALKVATSLDGKLAFCSGESKWVSHEESRERAGELRGFYDGILVGAQTLLNDQPRLTLRHPRFMAKKEAAIVVLDPEGSTLPTLSASKAFVECGNPKKFFVVVREDLAETSSEAQLVRCPVLSNGAFDLPFLMKKLFVLGICSLFVEGGAHTHSEFIRQGVAQRLYQFVSPVLMGDRNAITWTKLLEISQMKDRIELKDVRWEKSGPDAYVTGLF